MTVDYQNLFAAGNSISSIASGAFTGVTSGNLNLGARDFLPSPLLAPSATEYLVNIKVTENVGGATSQTALSAITVDTAPEPSTVLMFLSGMGALGFARLRRKK